METVIQTEPANMTRKKLLDRLIEAEKKLQSLTLPAHDALIQEADAEVEQRKAELKAVLGALPIAHDRLSKLKADRNSALQAFDQERRELHVLLQSMPLPAVDAWIQELRRESREMQQQVASLNGFSGGNIDRHREALKRRIVLINDVLKIAIDMQVEIPDDAAARERIAELQTTYLPPLEP